MADITDIRTRIREGKARVASMARGQISYLNKVTAMQAAEAEKNEVVNILKGRLTTEIAKTYSCLSPAEAKLLIDLVHGVVRKDRGVE